MANIDNRTEKRKLGDMGENIACDFLKRRGFEIVDRNYLRKWGEIDIVAKKDDSLRFIEVKTVSASVAHVTLRLAQGRQLDDYRPEENVHPWKLRRLSRAIQTYTLEKNYEGEWQLDIITVKIDKHSHRARIELIENIVI